VSVDPNIDVLTTFLYNIERKLEPAQQRKLLKAIANHLRKQNLRRIKRNVEPDGKAMIRRKRGSAKMFRKLGNYIKTDVGDNETDVGFEGFFDHIATNHQLGLEIRTKRYRFTLDKRILLGLSTKDLFDVKQLIAQHLMLSS